MGIQRVGNMVFGVQSSRFSDFAFGTFNLVSQMGVTVHGGREIPPDREAEGAEFRTRVLDGVDNCNLPVSVLMDRRSQSIFPPLERT